MGRAPRDRIRSFKWLGIFFLLAVPIGALAGLQPQGLQPQGLQPQGLQPQGLQPQGLQPQGLQPQGLQPQGLQPQGLQPQGLQPQGLQPQGLQPQGLQPQGVALMGNDLLGVAGKGVAISSVEMRGLTASSAIEPHVLTNVPMMSVGPGNYITVGGGSAVNHYAVAHLVDVDGNPAEDLDLFIAGEQKDPLPNLFHNFSEQTNQDELYVVYFFHKWSGQWMSLCPYNAATQSASAMPIPEDPANPNKFIFACTATGVDSKCARGWGYKPWAKTQAYVFDATANGGLGAWELEQFDLKPYYDVCTAAARAGYCQDGKSYTKTGTLVDLFDTRQIIWPNAIENPWNASNDSSLWMMAQEYFISTAPSPLLSSIQDSALQRTRYRELSPIGECDRLPYIDRLEHDNIEDGRWASPLTNTPRLQVFSPTYCTHDEDHEGSALPWDCSPCTTQVCKTMPGCCGAGLTPGWTAACTAQAATLCETGGVRWPLGKVWPKDLPASSAVVLSKYLFGPAGAVTDIDGVSGSSSSVTVSGWACDPEWSGATVAVRVYGGGPREAGGTLLGEVRADQAVALPLAREVSAACDGPGRDYARHGFSFTLPADQAGNVFVYAIDEATDDGPAAPPTLIRNGIVPVPRCAHSEHVAGEALSASCSSCAATVCGDGSHGDCCSVGSGEWTADCAAAADSCAATSSSAPVNARSFAAVTTGWIEPPATGTYTFEASLVPSRLYVNGTKVLDWFESSPGTTSGTIKLHQGQRYHLRWDRLQVGEPPGPPGLGVTWQPPGTVGQVAIPTANLYAIAPSAGSGGVAAAYYTGAGFTGGVVTRTDANIDINTDVAPPGPAPQDLPAGYGPSYSAIWDGEIVPSFTESYNFYVVGAGDAKLSINGSLVPYEPVPTSSAPGGCAHDLCALGDKLDGGCNSCVHDICQKDPYCCNGGYLSYYSVEPVWDARCISEVETYCPGSKCAPAAAPGTPQKKTKDVALQAGVHYAIHLEYSNPSADKTIRLLWVSPRQGKQAVPQFALLPPGPPNNAGSGLNVTFFVTKSENGVTKADLNTVVAAGAVADFSVTPASDAVGLPEVTLLASPVDASSGKPSPPTVVRPQFGGQAFLSGSGTVHVTGIGGIGSGYVHITVEGGAGDVLAPVGGDGHFAADVPIASGAQKLKLVQQTYGAAPCVSPALCAVSKDLLWEINVTPETAPLTAPTILSPTDPTHSPNPADNKFNVVGFGTTGPVHIVDQGSFPTAIPDILPDSTGKFSAQITLDAAEPGNPSKGWHKLLFDQGGPASKPVFVSVGIDPPTVEFPRSGAQIDCTQDDTSQLIAIGTLPYPQEVFGRLRVMEETGRVPLAFVGAESRIIQPQQPGDPTRFFTTFNPGPGRHVVYFFQAPDPPANATQDEIDAHFRAYARLADTPTSRIVFDRKPPRFPIPRGVAGLFGGRGATGGVFTNLPPPGQGPLTLGASNCGIQATPPASILCAEPNADVNLRVNGRLYTQRADDQGRWAIPVPLPTGWNRLTLAQVLDSRVGGAWSESCLSNEIDVGVQSAGAPILTVPPDMTVDAVGPQGTQVFYPDVTAVRAADGTTPVPVQCVLPSGSTFAVGRNEVLCTATDPTTGGVGLAEFAITVVDGPPTIQVSDLVVEADQATGTELQTYPVLVSDAVDTNLMLECVPPAPNFFLLDEVTPVTCEVTDHTNQKATGTFTVKVVDTKPPTLCPLSDILVGTNAGAGAVVTYATCADDVVDGPIAPSCDHPSGSFFPFGTTVVKCTATDAHHNAVSATFTVSVGDTTPPVLKLPTVVTAFATGKRGAKVSYTVTATDNIDPNPTVKCVPPSGSQFPLGKTPVTCTATDSSGNASQGTFIVKVIVNWSGLLPPVPTDGSGVFNRGSTIPTKFTLVDPSDDICDLVARLYVAPVDAAGNVGPERAAKSRPPSSGNTFAATGHDYHLNLDTGSMAVGRWQLRVDLGDGEPHPTLITLR